MFHSVAACDFCKKSRGAEWVKLCLCITQQAGDKRNRKRSRLSLKLFIFYLTLYFLNLKFVVRGFSILHNLLNSVIFISNKSSFIYCLLVIFWIIKKIFLWASDNSHFNVKLKSRVFIPNSSLTEQVSTSKITKWRTTPQKKITLFTGFLQNNEKVSENALLVSKWNQEFHNIYYFQY